MSRPYLKLVACVVVAFLLVGSSIAAASGHAAVRLGRAPNTPRGARVLGPLASTTQLEATVALRPRDPAALEQYALAVSTPGSALYHRYLSVAEFRQRFGPSSGQIAAVEASLRGHGLRPGAVSANGLAIPVRASAAALAGAFSTSFERVALPSGRTAFANASAPLIDSTVAPEIEGVIGLDNLYLPHPHLVHAHRAAAHASGHVATGGPQPCTAAVNAAPGQGHTADQLASAYRFSSLYGAGDLGAGQTVAIYELEPNLASDISAYESCYGISTSVSYTKVDLGAGSGSGQGEAALDIEDVIGLAPRANVIVYQGPNSSSSLPGAGPYDTYNRIISDNVAKVISTSWGDCEPDLGSSAASAESTLFQEAAAQGQSIFAAAGDSGSEDCLDINSSDALAVDDPGSQPFVTSVGGTRMSTLGPPPSESVWNGSCSGGPCGGGGGISALWRMPAYQSSAPSALHVVNTNSSGGACGAPAGGYCREVPDVSADADPATGYLIYYQGSWQGIGGTSAGAPLWAALMALTNAAPACQSSAVGFANPALYEGAGAAYAASFGDTTSGNNDVTGTHGGLYPARAGYDMASGLGTPNAAGLPAALCGSLVRMTNPGGQRSVVGVPVRVPITAVDPAGKPLTYSAGGLPAGVSIDPSTGLISGRPQARAATTTTVYAGDSDGRYGSTSFGWVVDPVAVSIASPGNLKHRLGRSLRLQIRASVNDGGRLRYSAAGLPAGLSVDRVSGLVRGRPVNGGRYAATVTAREGSASSSARFRWTIIGPGASRSSLSGIRAAKPRLATTIGSVGSAALRSLVISLPRGLSFGAVGGGVRVSGRGGKVLHRTAATLVHGRLRIRLRHPAGTVRIVVSSPSLRASQSLSSKVRRSKSRLLTVRVAVTDASGHVVWLTLSLKAS